jgi:carbon-monoxide dehydrogenase medium subunit
MNPFEWLEPQSFDEALALIDTDDPGVRPVAGGTALMLMMKAGVFAPSKLVSLHRLGAEHSAIRVTDDGAGIGALATLSALERNKEIAAAFPMIARTLPRLSNPRVRNVACVGGALAHGDPHMDLPPVMAALGAVATLRGPKGTRQVDIDTLYTGYYETVIERGELISEVHVPAMKGRRAAYLKITARTADDWPALGMAVSFRHENGKLKDVRVVASAATAMVLRLPETEAILEGASPNDKALREAGETAAKEAPVIGDSRGSAGYKRELLRVAVGRAVKQALAEGAAA